MSLDMEATLSTLLVGKEEIEEIEKDSTEIERQRRKNGALKQARKSWSTARSTGGQGRSIAQSTDVHDVHRRRTIDRTVDCG